MFEHMTTADRIQAAKVKTERVVDHLLYLLALHENNAIIVYSDTLSSQVTRSLAANAFNVFQGGLHQFEIVRLCALWDRASADRESIPTIIELIKPPDVIEALAQEPLRHWSSIGGDIMGQPEASADAALRRANEGFGEQEAQITRDELRKAIVDVCRILDSPKLKSIMNLRHKHLAHSLIETSLEKAGPVAAMKYGDERDVLFESVPIVEALHRGISGKGFSFENSQRIAREHAEALWKGCTFDIEK
jgi:HEPN superfamily AbiU2-like protein